jgi:tetratricopeptide (TPR) repeat protein
MKNIKTITRHSDDKRTMFLRTFLVFLLALNVIAISPSAHAFWGKKKTPEEQKQEKGKKAAKEYNQGLEKMVSAQKHAEKSDSTFAFNYRATQNAKAQKDYQRAIKKFDKAIELNPQMYEAFSERGFCFRKLGRLKESFASYKQCLDLKPDYAPAIEYRGEGFLAQNLPDSANAALRELERLATQSPADTMFTVYQETLRKAIQIYQLERFKK